MTGGGAIESTLIRKTPGVLGGAARIRDMRIAVWMLVRAKSLGLTDEQLLDRYDLPLTSQDLEAAWDYHAHHPEEVEADIRRNEEA